MGRKKALTKEDVFKATREILMKEGLHGVHFKKLASKLDVGRSTLYEYFENKDDLLLAYMKTLMDEMNEKVEKIPSQIPPNEKLYELLKIILTHAQIHQIDQMIRELQSSNKQMASFFRDELHVDLMKTYDLMIQWIEEAMERELWSREMDSNLIGDLLFHSILLPSRNKIGVEELASQLFSMIENGVSLKKK
ncbi:TetR/AcrR family transcriptional regulator [Halobacillus mangrovi]|uniref:TetR family transcriptional regulator n=1 Tax=Halobacillus mangrovi TaxID=402384 RepID=A0A1W5ZVG3_9BACI|nr:TetR/AcrR family transcriptional regulator [Halobacillus mangrovi]ARI77322.1 TetR family transcriptional regulator [Halobacillus mangrovi]